MEWQKKYRGNGGERKQERWINSQREGGGGRGGGEREGVEWSPVFIGVQNVLCCRFVCKCHLLCLSYNRASCTYKYTQTIKEEKPFVHPALNRKITPLVLSLISSLSSLPLREEPWGRWRALHLSQKHTHQKNGKMTDMRRMHAKTHDNTSETATNRETGE